MQPRIKLKRNPTSNNKDHIKNYICSNLRAKVLPSLLATKGNNAPKENWKTKGNKQQKRTQKNRIGRKNLVKNHRTWSKQQNNNKSGRKTVAAVPNTDMHNRHKKLTPWTAKATKEEEKSQGNKTGNHQPKTTTSHQNGNQQSMWQKQRNVGCTC